MNTEIEERIQGLEHIIYGMHYNINLLEYMSFGLHKEPFNLMNNLGLFWIWQSLLGSQIIDFYKLTGKHEKFSFIKISNILKEKKSTVDYDTLDQMTVDFLSQYEKNNLEEVRSKYLAHQDLRGRELKTDLLELRELTNRAVAIYQFLCNALKREAVDFTTDVISSFKEIFQRIDDYERISGFLIAKSIQNEESVALSELKELIKPIVE